MQIRVRYWNLDSIYWRKEIGRVEIETNDEQILVNSNKISNEKKCWYEVVIVTAFINAEQ